MSNLVRVLVLMSACLAFGAGAETFDKDKPIWEGGRLAHLARYIGTYNHEAVLNDPYVKAELQRLTGPYFERFMRIEGLTPIEYHTNNTLVLYGTHNFKADKEGKFVIVELSSGDVAASLGTLEWVKIFSVETRFEELPGVIQRAADTPCSGATVVPPPSGPNFEWIRSSKSRPKDSQRR